MSWSMRPSSCMRRIPGSMTYSGRGQRPDAKCASAWVTPTHKRFSSGARRRGSGTALSHGVELALLHYRSLVDVAGVEIRTHGTTLYNSIYRADDQALVNAHVWGVNAYGAPVWHLRRVEGGSMFDTYAESFDAVWSTAREVR